MIVLAQELRLLEEACALFPASGTQIYGCFARYGNGYPFSTTWLCQNEDGTVWGALGRYNSVLRLSCGALTDEQAEELEHFFGMTGCDTLELPLDAAKRFSAEPAKTGAVMEYRGSIPEITGQVETAPKPDDVFIILKESDPEFARVARFDEWLCDASHLCNHGAGWFYTIGKEASAGVTALSPKYGLIGAVATIPACRGRGYASLLTRCCVRSLLLSGRTPILMAADARAQSLYRHLGFIMTAHWAVIKL